MTRRSVLAWLALIAVAGIPLLLTATKYGPGISPDSITYILSAENFKAGRGVSIETPTGFESVRHFAPLFPITIGVLGYSGLSGETAAKVLNTVLFSLNIFLAGLISYYLLRCSPIFAILTSLVVLFSPQMVEIHAMAWSEPLSICLGFSGLIVFVKYLENGRIQTLVGASVLFGLSFFTRYAASAFGLSAICALILLNKRPFSKRVADGLLTGAIALFPMVFRLRSVHDVSSASISFGDFFAVAFDNLNSVLYTVAIWFVAESWPGILKRVSLAILLCSAAFLIRKYWQKKEDKTAFLVLLIFIGSYFLMLSYSIFVVRWLFVPDARMLSPVNYAVLLMLAVLLQIRFDRPITRMVAILFLVYLGSSYLIRTGVWVQQARVQGLGYNSPAWRTSPILRLAKRVPDKTLIYTNSPQVLQFFAGHRAKPFPLYGTGVSNVDAFRNKQYVAELSAMHQDLSDNDGILLYFYNIDLQTGLPTIGELRQNLPLEIVSNAQDGAIYQIAE